MFVKDIKLEEAWSELKSSVKYFRIFVYVAYMHVLDAPIMKLDDSSIKCIFFRSD